MDDELEQPKAVEKASTSTAQLKNDESDDLSDEDEEAGRDWAKLFNASRPVIPKRGEKEFEPAPGGGSGLQLHILDRARNAMFTTLRADRTISSKGISYAIWYPALSRSHVTLARGTYFSSVGYSVAREVEFEPEDDGEDASMYHERYLQKRLELLPEETIYMVERGSLLCWRAPQNSGPGGLSSGLKVAGLEHIPGPPMTVQQVYSEVIGAAGLTVEKLQVYTYLRRLGYVVNRAEPPDAFYPSAAPPEPVPPEKKIVRDMVVPQLTWFQRIWSCFGSWPGQVWTALFGRGFNWWKPVSVSRWLSLGLNYPSLFQSLRFLSSTRHDRPLQRSIPPQSTTNKSPEMHTTPYHIFYNVYKPSTPFKKSAPGPPDFRIVVVNARTTHLPTLYELEDLFNVVPEQTWPPPRQRNTQPQTSAPVQRPQQASQGQVPNVTNNASNSALSTPNQGDGGGQQKQQGQGPPQHQPRKANPFVALKTGRKMVVIATVDCGNISFFRFAQGDFSEWPMLG
ncbi:hypothetical protein BDN72DRAFT_800974 [Pluteus cervinus]|uniref:Uncharacterized protein n=1 Tax=Pluteus cervinus TaxID=181527 RepID=A0ACD3AI84_9AGAR|nr:hypothetical protein BDN72DRAFT_800974 [Pluteus cervinus]